MTLIEVVLFVPTTVFYCDGVKREHVLLSAGYLVPFIALIAAKIAQKRHTSAMRVKVGVKSHDWVEIIVGPLFVLYG